MTLVRRRWGESSSLLGLSSQCCVGGALAVTVFIYQRLGRELQLAGVFEPSRDWWTGRAFVLMSVLER